MAAGDEVLGLADRILERNLAWIAAADNKIPSFLTISTGMLGVLAALVPSATSWSAIQCATASIASLSLLGAIASLGFALFPRVDGPKSSLLFFEGIASLEREDYVERVLKGITPELLADYARQCHRNAEIAKRKHSLVRLAGALIMIGILPWLASVALLYLGRQGG